MKWKSLCFLLFLFSACASGTDELLIKKIYDHENEKTTSLLEKSQCTWVEYNSILKPAKERHARYYLRFKEFLEVSSKGTSKLILKIEKLKRNFESKSLHLVREKSKFGMISNLNSRGFNNLINNSFKSNLNHFSNDLLHKLKQVQILFENYRTKMLHNRISTASSDKKLATFSIPKLQKRLTRFNYMKILEDDPAFQNNKFFEFKYTLIEEINLIELKLYRLIKSYLLEKIPSLHSFLLKWDKLGLEVDLPKEAKVGEEIELKCYFAFVDTTNRPEMYCNGKLVKEFKGNQGIMQLKAKPDSAGYQLIKGKAKFYYSDGTSKWVYWNKKVRVVEHTK